MGLNYNYLLYFPHKQLWDALEKLGEMCDTQGMKPTTIQFPDHDLVLPLMSDWGEIDTFPYDKPEIQFAISINFEEDEAILDYLRNRDGDQFDRSPPEDGSIKIHSIGFIYLTVYTDLSQHYGFMKPTDLCLFKFGTTGTRMSFLFSDSPSIRKTFTTLLERCQGVTGIFDWENDYGELFWFKGRRLSEDVLSVHMLPDEIEKMLGRDW